MKYVVAYKWAPDPQDAQVSPDGTIKWGAKKGLSEYDPVAFRLARELADDTGAEVIGLTVGGEDSASVKATQAAAARGVDRLIVVADKELEDANPLRTAQVFADQIKRLNDVALVLTGDSSIDGGTKTFPGLVAAFLGAITMSEVNQVAATGDSYAITRQWDGGSQTMTVSSPAVLAVATDAVKVPVPGMKDLMAAKKKPVEKIDAGTLPREVAEGSATVSATNRPEVRNRKNQIFEGANAVNELVSALHTDGII